MKFGHFGTLYIFIANGLDICSGVRRVGELSPPLNIMICSHSCATDCNRYGVVGAWVIVNKMKFPIKLVHKTTLEIK